MEESSETNNTVLQTLYPDATYDFSVAADDLTVAPSTVDLLQNLTVSATVRNSGTRNAYNVPVRYSVTTASGQADIATVTVDIPAGSSITKEVIWRADQVGSDMDVVVTVDPGNSLVELAEDNNSASIKITVNAATDPNLTVSYEDIIVTPNPASQGDNAIITALIKNQGFSAASNINVDFYVGVPGIAGVLLGNQVIPSLAVGESSTVGVDWQNIPDAGEKVITVVVDPAHNVQEIAEDDNSSFITLPVLNLPDFAVNTGSISFLPAVPKDGDVVTVQTVVQNIGEQGRTDVSVTLYEGESVIGSETILTLAGNSQQEITFTFDTLNNSGSHQFRLVVDEQNLVVEQREDNNQASRILGVQNADLWLSERYISPNGDGTQDSTEFFFRLESAQTVRVEVVNSKGFVNRTFADGELEETLGSALTWEGLADKGTVVADGDYQIRVVDTSGSVLAALPVTVDNDRSPLTEAIGTDYLLQNNISCELPDIGYLDWGKTWLWDWAPDESGIVFLINDWDELLPDYPAGFYSMGPDGSGISPYFPTSWQDDSIYSSYYGFGLGMALSQDSQKLAFIRTIYKKSISARDYEVQELWAVDRSGANLTLLDSYLTNESKIEFAGDENYMPVGAWSPDGSKFAYFIRKNSGSRDEAEEGKLYIVNADGTGKIEIPIGVVTYYAGYPLKWSPDGKFLAYIAFDPDYDNNYLLELGIVDGADGSKLAVDNVARGYETYFLWAQDSTSVVYLTTAWTVGLDDADQALLSMNTVGEQKLLWQTEDWIRFDIIDESIYGPPFTLINENTIVISAYDYDKDEQQIYLLDLHGIVENNQQYTQIDRMFLGDVNGYENYYGHCEDYAVSSVTGLVAYADCSEDSGSIKVCDISGDCKDYENGLPLPGTMGWGAPYDLRWSGDGQRLAYVSPLPVQRDGWVDGHSYESLVSLDITSGEKKFFNLGPSENDANAEAYSNSYYENTLLWMGDNVSIIGSDQQGTFVASAESGALNYLPIEAYDYDPEEVRLSPLGNYITVNSYADTRTPCASNGNIWSLSSLLNLKAVLQVTKDNSALYLRGTAADRNFESFTLEYADLENPTVWQLIAPATYSPRVNEDFTSWVPPYEGNFLIRLTVRDKAGNEASSRKRVSWGMSASLTNLYQTEDIFSPNGDGVKDSVNLHYTVTEPIHLEFFVYNVDGLLVRSYSKDHSAAGVDYITWDGRDAVGQFVEDGDYVIKVFDYSFGFTVDTSPPQARIGFSGLYFADSLLKARLEGNVDDENLLEWFVEYGEGINPLSWHEYLRGSASILGDGLFKLLSGGSLDFAVNKQFRVTVKDEAGNVSVALTPYFLEEALLITKFDELFFSSEKDEQGEWQTLDRISLDKNIPGEHFFTVNETYRSSLSSVNVQYRIGQEWFDSPDHTGGLSSFAVIPWDNSTLASGDIEAMRVRGITVFGKEIFSNILLWGVDLKPVEETFSAGLCYDESSLERYKGTAFLDVPEDQLYLKFQISDSSGSVWSDFLDMGIVSLPDVIGFYPYPHLGENPYSIRMIGTTISGKEYLSDSIVYPPTDECSSDVTPPSSGGDDGSSGGQPSLFLSVNQTDAANCNSLAPGLVSISASPLYVDATLFRSLSYYLETDSGIRLLRTFDLTSEPWGKAVVDTNSLVEGAYTVKAVLDYEQNNSRETLDVQSIFFVDRVLPTAQLTGFCPATFDDPISGKKWAGLKIEGIADDNKGVKRYSLFYGYGENPAGWEPALNHDGYPITGGVKDGLLGVWDYSNLKWGTYTILLKTIDQAGNTSCDTKLFTINTTGRLQGSVETNLFSPNTDGKNDFLNISYDFTEQATITTEVWKSDELVRQISISESFGAPETVVWDGKDAEGSAGLPVEDGVYAIRIQATDRCGAVEQLSFLVTVDNTPPEVSINSPQITDTLAMLVPVIGVAQDLHFEQYTLEAISDTVTSSVASGYSPVAGGQLGSWNTNGLEGQWSLRLVASDRAGNTSEVSVSLNLGARNDLLKTLQAEPEIISPNDDEKRDSAEIRYELAQSCNAKFEIFDESSTLIESADLGAVEPGLYSFVWLGKDGTTAYPDGSYQVALTVTLVSDSAISQREIVKLTLDNTLPVIDIANPQDQVFLQDPQVIQGSLLDDNFATYSVIIEDENGVVWAEEGTQSRLDHVFVLINDLTDGSYTLISTVTDQAENITTSRIAFVIDKKAPRLLLDLPADGDLFGGDDSLVQIKGVIEETNLDHFILRYGAGEDPTLWTELVTANVLPASDELASLIVGKDAGVADGVYTLSLFATDRAGWESEVRIGFEVDNSPPDVAFAAPMADGYVTQPLAILGSVLDQNLREFSLSVAPGDCTDAYKWQILATSKVAVNNGELAPWKLLPADGKYCLNIQATDLNDLKAQQKINVQVDTVPPAAPVLTGKIENRLDALLGWSQNKEADLAGYNLYRDGKRINANLLSDLEYLDATLPEGEYLYTITAVDFAGQESDSSNGITLRVDITGPSVNIASPQDYDVVSDLIAIKGGAYSSDDFKEYRVYVGVGSNPAAWQQIRRSPVPIPYGDLANWDTLGLSVGQYGIKLEAEDLSGNVSSAVIEVSIDNEPPAPPVLLSAIPTNSDVDLLWQANSEADFAGYLLYRNHQMVNAQGAFVDDLTPYLIHGTAYIDSSMPDGTFVYYLEAMDSAGNISGQSNSLEVSIDMRPPHSTIVAPQTSHIFEYPLTVKAESVDSDVATVLFQYKKTTDTGWQDLQTVSSVPFVITFDPKGSGELYGDFNLRAIATDRTGKVDPFPEDIVVTYTDLTPPQPPVGLVSLTQGGQVNIGWQANSEADFAGYNLYQLVGETRVKLNTALLERTTFLHQGDQGLDLADGTYVYSLTAVDGHGNESKPSLPVEALVYAPFLQQPYTPSLAAQVALIGTAQPQAQVELWLENGQQNIHLGSLPANVDASFMHQVDLLPGENRLFAKATDAIGNVSKPSEQVVVILSVLPSMPTGLDVIVDGYNATSTWNANPEADILGYQLVRNDLGIEPTSLVSGGVIHASDSDWTASRAFDGSSSTYWGSNNYSDVFGPVWWQLDMPEQKLVNDVTIEWRQSGETIYCASDFEIQVWSGYGWVTKEKITGNSAPQNTFVWDQPYRTDKIRIHITDVATLGNGSKYVSLAEVRVSEEHIISSTSYFDAGLADGEYQYRVAAVNEYGFRGPFSQISEVSVGDVIAPEPPINLLATVNGSDVQLSWTVNSEADLAGYNVYLQEGTDWIKLNTDLVPGAAYLHGGLQNGSYAYRVTAIDGVGNESQPSEVATADIAIALSFSSPLLAITAPAEGSSLLLSWGEVTLAAGYNLYRSTSAGGPYAKTHTGPLTGTSYNDTGLVNGTSYYYVATAVDSLANESSYSNEVTATPAKTIIPAKPILFSPTISGVPLTVQQNMASVAGWAEPFSVVELFSGDRSLGLTHATGSESTQDYNLSNYVSQATMAPDGHNMAYLSSSSFYVYNTTTEEAEYLGRNAESPSWSPDGKRLAYVMYDSSWNMRLQIYDVENGNSSLLMSDQDVQERYPSWSADGAKIAFTSSRNNDQGIWLKDIVTGELSEVVNDVYPNFVALAPDARHLVFAQGGSLYLVDLNTKITTTIDEALNSRADYGNTPCWSPDSRHLVFASSRQGDVYIYVVDILSSEVTQVTDVVSDNAPFSWSPDGTRLLFVERQSGKIWSVNSADPIEQDLLATEGPYTVTSLHWPKSGEIFYVTDSTLHMIRPAGLFVFDDVQLDIGENFFTAITTDSSQNVSPSSEPMVVTLDSSQFPDLVVESADILVNPLAPLSGDLASIAVVVRNEGGVLAENVDVRLSMWEPNGQVVELTTITVDTIQPNGEAMVQVEWDSTAKGGDFTVVATVDGNGKILEASEVNNFALSPFHVALEEGVSLAMQTDKDSYAENEIMAIDLRLHNSGIAHELTLKVDIEDSNNVPVYLLDEGNVSLPYGSVEANSYAWNSGSTYAGTYQVHGKVYSADGSLLREEVVPFTIEPTDCLEAALYLTKTSFGPLEDVHFAGDLTNCGSNYNQPQLSARFSITDGSTELHSQTVDLPWLLADSKSRVNGKWNTALQSPGTYTAQLEVIRDNEVRVTAIQSFTIEPVVKLSGSVNADPGVIFLGRPASIDYGVVNNGNAPADALELTVIVQDAQTGALLNAATETMDLAVSASHANRLDLNASFFKLGSYTIRLQASRAGEITTLATDTLLVKDGTPPLVEILSPIAAEVYNGPLSLTVNATDNGTDVELVEYSFDGLVWLPLPAIAPGSTRYAKIWSPTEDDEGNKQVRFRATDGAGNLSAPVSVHFVVELKTPFDKLIGSLAVSPATAYQGEELRLPLTIDNVSKMDLAGITVRVLLIDPADNTTMATLEKGVFLPALTIYPDSFTYSSLELFAKEYRAVLQVISPEEGTRDLALTTFVILPSLAVELQVTSPVNLLVWVNSWCKHHHHRYQEREHEEHEYSNDDDGKHDDDHDNDKYDEHDDNDHQHRCSKVCFITPDCDVDCPRLDLLEEILTASTNQYRMVFDRESFEVELRNPLFTDILVLGDQNPLTDHFDEELREKVYSGTGLIVSAWQSHKFFGGHEQEDVLGLENKGTLDDHHQVTINTLESAISDPDSFTVEGKVAKVEVEDDALVAAWATYQVSCPPPRWGWTKKDDNKTTTEQIPAIVLHTYGLGSTLYYGFDLLANLDESSYPQLADLLSRSLAHISATSENLTELYPYQLIEVERQVTSLSDLFSVQVKETSSPELMLFDPENDQWVTDNPWTITMDIEPAATVNLPFYVILPDQAGLFNSTTDTGFYSGSTYVPYANLLSEFDVGQDSDQLLSNIVTEVQALSVSRKESGYVRSVEKYLTEVADRIVLQAKDIDKNIQDIEKAINALLHVDSADIHQIRLQLDRLLRVEQGRFYFFVPPLNNLTGTLTGPSTPLQHRDSGHFSYTITNDQDVHFDELKVRLRFSESSRCSPHKEKEEIELPAFSVAHDEFLVDTRMSKAGIYEAILEVGLDDDDDYRELARITFEII